MQVSKPKLLLLLVTPGDASAVERASTSPPRRGDRAFPLRTFVAQDAVVPLPAALVVAGRMLDYVLALDPDNELKRFLHF